MSKAEKTRHFIIKRVSPIFNRHGYAGTSLSQITEAIGLTKGAVYGNFESKEEIAVEALQYNFDQISGEFGKKLIQYENSCDRLVAFASFYHENYSKIALMGGCPLLNAATENDDGNTALKKRVIRLFEFWESSIRKIIERGISRNEINKNADIEQFSSLFTPF